MPTSGPAQIVPTIMPAFMGADTTATGSVTLGVFGPAGGAATYYERIGRRRVLLGRRTVGSSGQTLLEGATTWRCDRLVRHFEADVRGLDGTAYAGSFSVRTPSCANRFSIAAPTLVGRGRTVTVDIRDAWRSGDARPRVCLSPPRRPTRCRIVPLRRGQIRTTFRFKATRTGRWKVRLRLAAAHPLRTIQVGGKVAPRRRAAAPEVLATGDSTIQGVDGFLADQLGDSARVLSRQRTGTGISKPGRPSWLKASLLQSSTRPAATVVSLGVNEGFAMRTPAGPRVICCGEPWVAEYSRRARIMMRTWTRFGGHVAWMTLSTPGIANLRTTFSAVNAALARAAVGLPRVSLIRADLIFSPGGTHQPTRLVGGRRVRMYLRDGVHLSPAGTAIAADAVAAELRRSGALAHQR